VFGCEDVCFDFILVLELIGSFLADRGIKFFTEPTTEVLLDFS
jgi:hypothetical protein